MTRLVGQPQRARPRISPEERTDGMKKKLRSCGVLLFRTSPELSFLLMKHPKRWDLPKGHVDPGESDLECALREMEEETGIGRDNIDLLDDFRFETEYHVELRRYDFQPRLKTLRIYLGRLRTPQPIVVSEHEDHHWWPWMPPHQIQSMTIDPLLASVEQFAADHAATWKQWLGAERGS